MSKEKSIVKKPKFVGLDISVTATGLTVIEGKRVKKDNVRMTTVRGKYEKGGHIFSRILSIRDRIVDFIGEGEVTLACVEEPLIKVGTVRSSRRLLELNSVVCFSLYQAGIPFLMPVTQQLKKIVTGFGNADKEDVINGIRKEFDILTASDDEADSLALALIAMTAYKLKSGDTKVKIGKYKTREMRYDVVKRVFAGKNRVFAGKNRVFGW